MESRSQIQEHPRVARADGGELGARRRRSLRLAAAPAAPLSIERRRLEAVVALTGELDLAAAARTEAESREAGAHAKLVVLDLRGLLDLTGANKRLRVGWWDPAARDTGCGMQSSRAGRLEMGGSDAR
jgi:hypothetical protein